MSKSISVPKMYPLHLTVQLTVIPKGMLQKLEADK